MTHFLITSSLTMVVALVIGGFAWWVWGRGLWWWAVGGVGFASFLFFFFLVVVSLMSVGLVGLVHELWLSQWWVLPNHAQLHFANHALVSFKKSLSIPRPIDYANNRQLDTTFCPLDSHKFCPLHIPFFSQSLYFIPLSRILYFISYNTIFSLFASKASKQNIPKALWEEIESWREKFEGCQHCQANTHLQLASHHRNTAVITSINVFSYAQKIWYGLFSFGLGI